MNVSLKAKTFVRYSFFLHKCRYALTCIGDGEAVGRFYIVDVWDQVERGFCGIWAGVVKKYS